MDVRKAAPPGRKTSKKGSFQGGKLVDGIEYDVNGVRIRKPGEVEVDDEDNSAAEAAEAAARAQAEAAEAEAAAAREEAEARAAASAAREHAKALAAQKAAEEEARAAEAERLEQRRQARAERERQQQLEQESQERQEREAAEAAALEEERAARRAAAAAKARQEEEQRRQQEEEAELEAQRTAYEAKMAAKRARQEREEAERLAREAAEEEERRRVEEEEAELNRAIEAERARRAAARAEQERLEREAAEVEAAEEQRQREQRVAEANAAAAAALASEDAALAEKRRRAEEQRKKRAMFLNDMDTFSDSFETQAAVQQREREAAAGREQDMIRAQLAQQSSSYAAPARQAIVVPEEPPMPKPAPVVVTPPAAPAPAPVAAANDGRGIRLGGGGGAEFDNLSSSLFATGHVTRGSEFIESNPINRVTEELRSATRIGGAKKTATVSASPPSVVAPAAVTTSPIPPPAAAASSTNSSPRVVTSPTWNPSNLPDNDDDDEENGLSDFLTREERMTLSATEKANWRAKRGDLNKHKHEFHGAVTYAFDGIFSWQMYGSAEAIDEAGRAYTEYLMRCQWGTTWENLQPWIAARRYREFEVLDSQLKAKFPTLAPSLLPLPQKDFFRALESDVVQKRRQGLEDYVSKIVSTMPAVVRSEQLNEFLGIEERVTAIRAKLHHEERDLFHQQQRALAHQALAGGDDPNSPTEQAVQAAMDTADLEDSVEIFSAEQAERVREETNCPAFDEDDLGHLEEDIKELCIKLRDATPQTVRTSQPIKRLMMDCCKRWPRLRATAVLGVGVDFSLIPRAMQADEDLGLAVNEYRSLKAAGNYHR